MAYKSITVKTPATTDKLEEFTEYEYPILNGYLDKGWKIEQVHTATTNLNVGFLFITFVLLKA